GLHVDAEQHAEPDQVDAELVGDRADQRNDDERKLEEVEKERQQEDQAIDDDQESQLAARQVQQQLLDPDVAVDAVEGQAENARADEDEHDERRKLGRRVHRLAKEFPAQSPAHQRHDQRPARAHRAALGRRGDAEENRAEDEKDQRERRYQYEHDALGQPRQQPELEYAVQHRGEERDTGPDAGRDDQHFVGRVVRTVFPVRESDRRRSGDDRQHQQRARAPGAAGLAQGARFQRQV